MQMKKENAILKIREFNRFYMPALELLGNHYLGSEYSAAEARVLFEIYENDGCNASYIANEMNIDKSYLSRIIKKHEKNGFIVRKASETDTRALDLHLTELGENTTKDFIEKSNRQIGKMIESLSENDCKALVDSFQKIANILEKTGYTAAKLQ